MTSAELPVEVVTAAQRGDRAAQTVVLTRYAGPLHHLVRRIAGPSADVESLTQALLEHLLAVLPRFKLEGLASLTTWVFTVAHHFLLDELRRKHLEVVPLEHAHEVAGESDPHHERWRSEVRSALEVAIGRLPLEQRRVFVLVHLHEQPLEAVAQAEGVPLGTVKSRLFRAKAALARELGALNPRAEVAPSGRSR